MGLCWASWARPRQADWSSSRLTGRQLGSKGPHRLRTPMTAAASKAYRAIQDALQCTAGGGKKQRGAAQSVSRGKRADSKGVIEAASSGVQQQQRRGQQPQGAAAAAPVAAAAEARGGGTHRAVT
jgi:hypothetical protein